MPALLEVLSQSGGVAAGREHSARLRALLATELHYGARELGLTRSGYEQPVLLAFVPADEGLLAVAPAQASLRADPAVISERGWLVVAAAVGALGRALGASLGSRSDELTLTAGRLGGWLALALTGRCEAPGEVAELAGLDFDEQVAGVDRLRARSVVLPAHVGEAVEDLRPPIGATHPLRIAEAVARLGGQPADPASVDHHEEAVLALLQPPAEVSRAHDDPDPARRVARRILQRLDGMGKWGGYHTEFVHLTRGFPPAQRALAADISERLLAEELLAEKISVGQRHVYLNPRRSGDIKRLVDTGTLPGGLTLPALRGTG